MGKVLLVGKMNNLMKNMSDYLQRYFVVQFCDEKTSNMSAFMKVVEPDIVVVLLVGDTHIDENIFDVLVKEYPDTHVITIGSKEETMPIIPLVREDQFECLLRPIKNLDVLEKICRRLGMVIGDLPDSIVEEERAYEQMVQDKMKTESKKGSDGVNEAGSELSGTNNKRENDGASSPDQNVAQTDAGTASEAQAADSRKLILIVDDNAMNLRTEKAMIPEKYRVNLANSGAKAMVSIGKDRPDLILLDYEMPGCDGKQTLEMIRADEEYKDIPVIFLTGVNQREQIQAVLELKPAGYLLKPPTLPKLMAAIEKALGSGN